MKNLFLFIALISSYTAFSQNQYKVSYRGKIISSAVLTKLSKELQDPAYLKAFKDLLGKYEVNYSLYIDATQKKSLMLIDNESGLDGPPPYKHKLGFTSKNTVYFEELFRGKVFNIKDRPETIQWNITQITQKIGSYTCRKAVLKNDPYHTEAWFSEDLPLPYGPALGVNLPGLVILYENDYFLINVNNIKKEKIPSSILNTFNNYEKKSGIPFSQYYKEVTPVLKKMENESIVN